MSASRLAPVALAAAALLAAAAPARAAVPPPALAALDAAGVHEIIVKHRPGERATNRPDLSLTHVEDLPLPGVEVVRAPAGELAETVEALRADPSVAYADPNAPVRALTSDPLWSHQWGLSNPSTPGADIDVLHAWAVSRGAGQTVAVVDSGAWRAHPDLAGRFDEAAGWDFVDGDGDPQDANGHGTHVAGIIAADADNGQGVAGIAPLSPCRPARAERVGRRLAGRCGQRLPARGRCGRAGQREPRLRACSRRPRSTRSARIRARSTWWRPATTASTWTAARRIPVRPAGGQRAVRRRDDGDRRAAGFSDVGAASVDVFAPGDAIASSICRAPVRADERTRWPVRRCRRRRRGAGRRSGVDTAARRRRCWTAPTACPRWRACGQRRAAGRGGDAAAGRARAPIPTATWSPTGPTTARRWPTTIRPTPTVTASATPTPVPVAGRGGRPRGWRRWRRWRRWRDAAGGRARPGALRPLRSRPRRRPPRPAPRSPRPAPRPQRSCASAAVTRRS